MLVVGSCFSQKLRRLHQLAVKAPKYSGSLQVQALVTIASWLRYGPATFSIATIRK
jgi:hypothetical protein